ncbi:MAG: cadherin-like beta sandwich domain-containing protein [Spirochaetales bacterium]|nr:cadherin-like beta sandwich domain-containing protein [Spirochaetales bacterium]
MKARATWVRGVLTLTVLALGLYLAGCPNPTVPSGGGPTSSDDASLAALTVVWVQLGPLDLGFVPGTTDYDLDVPNCLEEVEVTPFASDTGATIRVSWSGSSWTALASGDPITVPFAEGLNTIQVEVTAEDGASTAIYTVDVNRAASDDTNADLAYLLLSEGDLDPPFDRDTEDYDVSVAHTAATVWVTPFICDSAATATVNGEPAPHAAAYGPIIIDSGEIEIVVTAGDGITTKTYTVTVHRASPPSSNANLSDLEPSSGSLDPHFDPDTDAYTVAVPVATNSIAFTPTAEDPDATITVNGASVDSGSASGPIPLSVGSNTVTIAVLAEDLSTSKTYTVTVKRNPSISGTVKVLVPAGAPDLEDPSDTWPLGFTCLIYGGDPIIQFRFVQITEGGFVLEQEEGGNRLYSIGYQILDLSSGTSCMVMAYLWGEDQEPDAGEYVGQTEDWVVVGNQDKTGVDLVMLMLENRPITVGLSNASAANGKSVYFALVLEGEDPEEVGNWQAAGSFVISGTPDSGVTMDPGTTNEVDLVVGVTYDVYLVVDMNDNWDPGNPEPDDDVDLVGEMSFTFTNQDGVLFDYSNLD